MSGTASFMTTMTGKYRDLRYAAADGVGSPLFTDISKALGTALAQILHLSCALLKVWGVLGVFLQSLEAHPEVASCFPRRNIAVLHDPCCARVAQSVRRGFDTGFFDGTLPGVLN